jgi:hypothetical protein
MKEIQLTQWNVVFVDDDDFDELSKYKWIIDKWHKTNYAYRREFNNWIIKTILIHRHIIDIEDKRMVDHIDGNWLNNQKSNLRLCTNSQNQMNRWKTVRNSSWLKWVSWQKTRNKWYAQIKIDWKQINLWRFDNKEDAYKSYCDACIRLHWDFAHT